MNKLGSLARLSWSCCLGLPLLLATVSLASAQEFSGSEVLVQEGIASEPDKKNRAPIVSVRVVQEEGTVKILTDAFVANKQYQQYPIRFQYYINRGLFAGQYRSSTLPGPVGIDIGPDVATPPFNYTVVAELITPFGRNFSTVLEGAVFASNLAGLFDCTLTTFSSDVGTIQEAAAVSFLQQGNDTVQFSSTFRDQDDPSPTAVDALVTISGTTAQATVTLRDSTSTSRTELLTGTVEIDSATSGISNLELSSDDERVDLSCELSA